MSLRFARSTSPPAIADHDDESGLLRSTGLFVMRIADLGVDVTSTYAHIRWVRTINVAAMASMFLSVIFSFVYSFLDFHTLWPVVVTNLVWSVGYVVVIAVNSRGHPRLAAWTLLVVGWGNTIIPGAALGASTGIYLFLVLVPMVGMMVSGPDDHLMRGVVLVGGVAMFAAIPMLFPDAPEGISGTRVESALFIAAAIGVATFGASVALYYRYLADSAESALAEANERSERLLLNILPGPIADRLKADESPIADRADEVTVLFADLVDSTPLSEFLSADELVALLNRIFSEFDDLTESFGLEKVATIGDGYLAVSGLPIPRPDHMRAACEAALAMQSAMTGYHVPGFGVLQMRFGLSSGPVVAGVIGRRKFRYDLWGDTVNTASRMQSQGRAGMIHVTADIRDALDTGFKFQSRETIEIKGKGPMETFFLIGPRGGFNEDSGAVDRGVPVPG
jgi:guanylate cyclase